MKKSKIGKLAALLAAGALLLNGFFMSCAAGDSGDDSSDDSRNASTGGVHLTRIPALHFLTLKHHLFLEVISRLTAQRTLMLTQT